MGALPSWFYLLSLLTEERKGEEKKGKEREGKGREVGDCFVV